MNRDADSIEREAKKVGQISANGTIADHAAIQILLALVEELAENVARLEREVRLSQTVVMHKNTVPGFEGGTTGV